MLGQRLKQLGKILIPLAVGAWGLFALAFGGPVEGVLDAVPREIWLFGLVLASAGVAVGLVALWLRARRPDNSRW
jgi:hypothetical protein